MVVDSPAEKIDVLSELPSRSAEGVSELSDDAIRNGASPKPSPLVDAKSDVPNIPPPAGADEVILAKTASAIDEGKSPLLPDEHVRFSNVIIALLLPGRGGGDWGENC